MGALPDCLWHSCLPLSHCGSINLIVQSLIYGVVFYRARIFFNSITNRGKNGEQWEELLNCLLVFLFAVSSFQQEMVHQPATDTTQEKHNGSYSKGMSSKVNKRPSNEF